MRRTVFLGGGRITSALVSGMRVAGDAGKVVVFDRNPAKLRALRRELKVEIALDVKSAVERADLVVVAVRPDDVPGLLKEVAECDGVPKMCVSLAAGVPIRRLRAWLPEARWARGMPSPVCRTAQGLTGLCFDRGVSKREREQVRRFFRRVGQVVEIRESSFDAFTATYSSSHGYHVLETLASAAQRTGLDRQTALTAAAHALADGILYWRESRQSLDQLLREAVTPGGIAAATIDAMDKAGYKRAVEKGLRAGIARARRNAKIAT